LFSSVMGIPRQRFAVVPNGAELIKPASRRHAALQEPLIVSIGRLERYKGHHRVIEAMPAVLAEIPNARLRVLGEGPYKAQLLKLVDRLDLHGRVEIAGIAAEQRADLTRTLSQAALITLLSDYEAHPVAVMEALSLKRPVLVADCTGLAEIAKKGLAAAIPLHTPAAGIARAIVDQIRQPRIMPDVALPNWDDCAGHLLEIYESIPIETQRRHSEGVIEGESNGPPAVSNAALGRAGG
jgi:glycosyltransferase involved in cell wall biosynthesis